MSTYLETIGRKFVEIPSNGKCLLLAIKKCLEVDFDIKRVRKYCTQDTEGTQRSFELL